MTAFSTFFEVATILMIFFQDGLSHPDPNEPTNGMVYLKLDLTGMGTPGASSWAPDHPASYAFTPDKYWRSADGQSLPHTIWFQFNVAQQVDKISISKGVGQKEIKAPYNFHVFGSSSINCGDENSWVILKQMESENNTNTITFNKNRNRKFFKCYGFKIFLNRWTHSVTTAVSGISCFKEIEAYKDCKTWDDNKGIGYRGKKNVTQSGFTCQEWSKQVPHTHSFKPHDFVDADLSENYCRNPDHEDSGPWCYTANSHVERVDSCTINVCDPCDPHPCGKGICDAVDSKDFSAGYNCQCPDCYSGDNCETHDFCCKKPCKNGATCSNSVSDYKCTCRFGFDGKDCSHDLKCSPNPCQNNGVCEEDIDGYHCHCKSPWIGTDCKINNCKTNPCQNGGVCENEINGYRCNCKKQWSGTNCEKRHILWPPVTPPASVHCIDPDCKCVKAWRPYIELDCRYHKKTFEPEVGIKILQKPDVDNAVFVGNTSPQCRLSPDGKWRWFSTDQCGFRHLGCTSTSDPHYIDYYNELNLIDYTQNRKLIKYGCQYNLTCKFDRTAYSKTFYEVLWRSQQMTDFKNVVVNLSICNTNQHINCSNSEFCIHQRVHVKAEMQAQYQGYKLFFDRCWTTPTKDPNLDPLPLIKNGKKVAGVGLQFGPRTSNTMEAFFNFQAFQHIPKDEEESCTVYIHCEVVACSAGSNPVDPWSKCKTIIAGGEQRRKRSLADPKVQPSEILQSYVNIGPLKLKPPGKGECEVIDHIKHGMVECSNGFTPASSCSFKCDPGYYLHGLKPEMDFVMCRKDSDSLPRWSQEIPTCRDINECATERDPCRQGMSFSPYKCVNLPGTYKCLCRPGYGAHPVSPWKCSPGKTFSGSVELKEPPLDFPKFNPLILSYLVKVYQRLLSSKFTTIKLKRVVFDDGKNMTTVRYEVFIRTDDPAFQPPKLLSLRRTMRNMFRRTKDENVKIHTQWASMALKDKDECVLKEDNDCSINANCFNGEGSFSCECKFGYEDMKDTELDGRLCGTKGYKDMLKHWSSIFEE